MRADLRSYQADGIKLGARRAEITSPHFVKWGIRDEKQGEQFLELCFSWGADTIVPPFAFRGVFMAGASVGDIPAHRLREFNAGSTAMNVKARVSVPKGIALTEWPLSAMCGQ